MVAVRNTDPIRWGVGVLDASWSSGSHCRAPSFPAFTSELFFPLLCPPSLLPETTSSCPDVEVVLHVTVTVSFCLVHVVPLKVSQYPSSSQLERKMGFCNSSSLIKVGALRGRPHAERPTPSPGRTRGAKRGWTHCASPGTSWYSLASGQSLTICNSEV